MQTPNQKAHRRRFLKQLIQAGVAAEVLASAESMLGQDEEPLAVEGYFDRMSCAAGESVGLCISTNAERVSVQLSRVGVDQKTVWKNENVSAGLYPVPDNVAMVGCGWPVAVQIPVARHWRSGIYVAKLYGHIGNRKTELREALFIVRSANPGKDSKILLQVATNTYQAYNEWGGTNLYSGPDFPRVSFQRPFKIYDLPLLPGANWYNPNTSNYHAWDEPFVRWAEQAGYWIDCCSNLDLEFHPEILERYKLVLSVGHDEYWSAGMRDALEKYIERGGNFALFSGNSICWQVRVEKQGRELVCYKRVHDRDPVFKSGKYQFLTTLWSDPLVERPENYLSGVGFPYGGYNGLHGEFMDRDGLLDSDGTQPAYIGSAANTDEFFHGSIDELRIYQKCLTPDQIKKLSESDRDVQNDQLTGWWDFDDDLQNRAPAAQGEPAERVGAGIGYVTGRHGKAVRLNGRDQTLRIKSYPGLKPTTGQLTMAAWIRPASEPDLWFEVYRKEDGDARQLLAIGKSGYCGVWCGLGIDKGYYEMGGRVEPDHLYDGNWHHIAATFDGVDVRIYHDGTEVGRRTIVEQGAGEYTVHRPDHWILEGTGLKRGDTFGAEDGIAGYECDGCEFVMQDGLPVATGRDGTPKNFEIVATAPARWDLEEGSLGWAHSIRESWPKAGAVPENLKGDGNAALGSYTRGGTVVTTGSCDWSDGMKSGNSIVDRIAQCA